MLRLKAYAKINLTLKIIGQYQDVPMSRLRRESESRRWLRQVGSYHELESIMQSVSLSDIVTLEPSAEGIVITTNNSRLPDDNRNLAYRAAEAFFEVIRSKKQVIRINGIKINLEKNIPIAAGLAGGSADAAAVLYGLNQMTNDQCQMSNEGLINLGAQIGSDVPFCLTGGRCLVKGRGEKLERLSTNQPNHLSTYIIVVPEVEVATKWAYDIFDEMTNDKLQITNEGNDLEAVVINKYPVIQEVKDRLLKLGCGKAQMSGSGPSVFGTVKNANEGEAVLAEIKQYFSRSFLVHSVERGIEEF